MLLWFDGDFCRNELKQTCQNQQNPDPKFPLSFPVLQPLLETWPVAVFATVTPDSRLNRNFLATCCTRTGGLVWQSAAVLNYVKIKEHSSKTHQWTDRFYISYFIFLTEHYETRTWTRNCSVSFQLLTVLKAFDNSACALGTEIDQLSVQQLDCSDWIHYSKCCRG